MTSSILVSDCDSGHSATGPWPVDSGRSWCKSFIVIMVASVTCLCIAWYLKIRLSGLGLTMYASSSIILSSALHDAIDET